MSPSRLLNKCFVCNVKPNDSISILPRKHYELKDHEQSVYTFRSRDISLKNRKPIPPFWVLSTTGQPAGAHSIGRWWYHYTVPDRIRWYCMVHAHRQRFRIETRAGWPGDGHDYELCPRYALHCAGANWEYKVKRGTSLCTDERTAHTRDRHLKILACLSAKPTAKVLLMPNDRSSSHLRENLSLWRRNGKYLSTVAMPRLGVSLF